MSTLLITVIAQNKVIKQTTQLLHVPREASKSAISELSPYLLINMLAT